MDENKIYNDLNQLSYDSAKLLYLINYIYENGKINFQQKRKLKEYVCQEKAQVFNLLNNIKDINKFIYNAKLLVTSSDITKDQTKSTVHKALISSICQNQIQQQNENKNEDDKNTSSKDIENKEEIDITKKRKKMKLKTFSINENKRYIITDASKKNNDKDDFSVIEEEDENKKVHKRKKNKFVTKSVEKVRFPNISSNSLISIQIKAPNKNMLTESYDSHVLRRKKEKDRTIHFPKISSLHRNNLLSETEKNYIFETENRLQDNDAIKIYNKANIDNESSNPSSSKNQLPQVNNSNQDADNEEKTELFLRPRRKTNRLLSIFEKEKLRKNNYNLFLGEKNNYLNKEHRDIMNNEMAKQIHNLKKQLKGNSNKNIIQVHK